MTFGFRLCYILYGVGLGSGSRTFFTFVFGAVLCKPRFPVRVVLAGLRFFRTYLDSSPTRRFLPTFTQFSHQ